MGHCNIIQIACVAPSYYLKWCGLTVSWMHRNRNKFHGNLNQKTHIFYQKISLKIMHPIPWPWIFQGQNLKQLWVWCAMKRKQINWILGWHCGLGLWPYPWSWPWIFEVKVWNILISGMGVPITMAWKGRESTIHDHDCDICLTMVEWVLMYWIVNRVTWKCWYAVATFSCSIFSIMFIFDRCHHR